MPNLHASPAHQRQCYWLWYVNVSLPSNHDILIWRKPRKFRFILFSLETIRRLNDHWRSGQLSFAVTPTWARNTSWVCSNLDINFAVQHTLRAILEKFNVYSFRLISLAISTGEPGAFNAAIFLLSAETTRLVEQTTDQTVFFIEAAFSSNLKSYSGAFEMKNYTRAIVFDTPFIWLMIWDCTRWPPEIRLQNDPYVTRNHDALRLM